MSVALTALTPAAALLLALAIDRWLGEPSLRLHPVVWMGNYLGWTGRRIQKVALQSAAGQPVSTGVMVATLAPDYKAFWLGTLFWSAGAAVVFVASWWLQSTVMQGAQAAGGWLGNGASALLGSVLLALLLKPMLAWRMLQTEVLAVDAALAESLQAGRTRLSWLVSRDTAALSEAQVRESAIESLAENLSDSVVAPIFWFVLLGLPGAVLYRFANTADAMWGYKGVYKGQNWEWAGKWAARVDDVLNWLPARLTGLLLALTCGVKVGALRREAAKTPSPNSGWPMAAMALALSIHLGKPGVYVLNPAGSAPLARHTPQAICYASKALLALLPIALVALLFKAWIVL